MLSMACKCQALTVVAPTRLHAAFRNACAAFAALLSPGTAPWSSAWRTQSSQSWPAQPDRQATRFRSCRSAAPHRCWSVCIGRIASWVRTRFSLWHGEDDMTTANRHGHSGRHPTGGRGWQLLGCSAGCSWYRLPDAFLIS